MDHVVVGHLKQEFLRKVGAWTCRSCDGCIVEGSSRMWEECRRSSSISSEGCREWVVVLAFIRRNHCGWVLERPLYTFLDPAFLCRTSIVASAMPNNNNNNYKESRDQIKLRNFSFFSGYESNGAKLLKLTIGQP